MSNAHILRKNTPRKQLQKHYMTSDNDGMMFGKERINAILDNKQQAMFNRWVATLTEINLADKVALAPFEAYQQMDFIQKRTQIEQQYASLYGNHALYPYV